MSTEEHRRAASDVRQRTELVGLRLTPDEHSAAESRAAAAGVTVQELIRHLLAAPTSPSEPVPSTPRVWAMPEIPEDVSAVRDGAGWIWRRATDYEIDRWWRRAGGTMSAESRLIDDHGPLAEFAEVEETNDGSE